MGLSFDLEKNRSEIRKFYGLDELEAMLDKGFDQIVDEFLFSEDRKSGTKHLLFMNKKYLS
jgi:hypothetical protein